MDNTVLVYWEEKLGLMVRDSQKAPEGAMLKGWWLIPKDYIAEAIQDYGNARIDFVEVT